MQNFTSIPFFGESLSIFVAVSWTISALFSEVATKRLGVHVVNVLRMVLSMLMISSLLYVVTGSCVPLHADVQTWWWLLMSGVVGYVFGDYCLFNAYAVIGSRFAQLFMTVAPATAAISGWILLGETLSLSAVLGMSVTTLGIALSILGRGRSEEAGKRRIHLNLPTSGVLYAIGAAVGQGLGLVLSAVGLKHYEASIRTLSLPSETLDGLLQTLPFASTMIRAVAGLAGFVFILLVSRKGGALLRGVVDRRGMTMLVCAVFFGPFFGVSLSLMATQYTATGIAMTLMSLSPILILWPAHLFFGQRVTRKEVLGAVISVLGVSLFFIRF